MFHLYKSKDNGRLFTNPVEIPDPALLDLEYLGPSMTEFEEGYYEHIDGKWVKPDLDYAAKRQGHYPKLAEQLDSLWHDIDQGLFGTKAKTGAFYLSLATIKTEFPKTDK